MDVVQIIDYFPNMYGILDPVPNLESLCTLCNPSSTQEVEVGGSEVHRHPMLSGEPEDSVEYIKPCFKNFIVQ